MSGQVPASVHFQARPTGGVAFRVRRWLGSFHCGRVGWDGLGASENGKLKGIKGYELIHNPGEKLLHSLASFGNMALLRLNDLIVWWSARTSVGIEQRPHLMQ